MRVDTSKTGPSYRQRHSPSSLPSRGLDSSTFSSCTSRYSTEYSGAQKYSSLTTLVAYDVAHNLATGVCILRWSFTPSTFPTVGASVTLVLSLSLIGSLGAKRSRCSRLDPNVSPDWLLASHRWVSEGNSKRVRCRHQGTPWYSKYTVSVIGNLGVLTPCCIISGEESLNS